jgi:hypothetical protein
MLPLIYDEVTSIRQWAIGGVFGQWVQIQDGTHKYMRAPARDGFPLSMWSNRWSTMPVTALPGLRLPDPDKRAWLDFMPGSTIPVIRQPFAPGDLLPFWSMNPAIDEHHLYNIDLDPDETENRVGESGEADMIELLRVALRAVSAPDEQLERLDIG